MTLSETTVRRSFDAAAQSWCRLRSDHQLRRRLLRELQQRRDGRSDLVQFDVIEHGDRWETLAVRNELLVRTEILGSAAARKAVADLRLQAVPVRCLDGRVSRLVGSEDTGGVDKLLREAVARGLSGSVNHVARMGGVVMKGGSVPTWAPARSAFPLKAGSAVRGPVVAILDTGIDARSRSDGWLADLVTAENVEPVDAVPADGERDPGAGHGTFVAGVAQQVTPGADVRMYRVLDAEGLGSEVGVACATLRAAADGAAIINLSLGTYSVDDAQPVAFQVALELLAERYPDVLVVAAAGNDGGDRPCWPAAFPDVVAVGGLTGDLRESEWSNHGDWVTCSTVGERIVSTYIEGRRAGGLGVEPAEFGPDAWACWTGTSFAAPQIAAAVAARCTAEPGLTPRQALDALLAEGQPVPGFGQALCLLSGAP